MTPPQNIRTPIERTRQEAAAFLRRFRHELGLRVNTVGRTETFKTFHAMGFLFTNGQRKTPLLDIIISD